MAPFEVTYAKEWMGEGEIESKATAQSMAGAPTSMATPPKGWDNWRVDRHNRLEMY